jgi:hypothetical protein
METYGLPGRIHVSAATRQVLGNAFRFEPRGPLDVKVRGADGDLFPLPAIAGVQKAGFLQIARSAPGTSPMSAHRLEGPLFARPLTSAQRPLNGAT